MRLFEVRRFSVTHLSRFVVEIKKDFTQNAAVCSKFSLCPQVLLSGVGVEKVPQQKRLFICEHAVAGLFCLGSTKW